MKAFGILAAAGFLSSAIAQPHFRRVNHAGLHKRLEETTCGCTETVTVTETQACSAPAAPPTNTVLSTTYLTTTVFVTASTPAVPNQSTPDVLTLTNTKSSYTASPSAPPAPTHHITTFTTPGTYTIPEKTITLTSTATVCDATSTPVGPGEHTFGGVTTVVSTHTTVTCPVATTSGTGTDVTSFITHTTYVCPSAGTYTIGTFTTSVPASSTIVFPTPATYTPGTYHQPSTVVTVTDTKSVYVCPANPTPVGPASTSVAATTTVATTPAATTPVATSASVTQSTSIASSTPAATPSSTPNTGNGKRAYGMTFSPYTKDGQCMNAEDVDANVAKIAAKGIPTIRVYGTDCNGLENISAAAKKHGLKLIVGVFIDSNGVAGAKDFVQDIVKWGQWELVELIVVGNEAIQNGYTTATELAGFITSSASAFKGAGYTGSITTTEPIGVWEKSGSVLCPVVDVLGANLHPFFNAQTKAANAGTFVKSQFDLLKKTCNGKKVINLETGWPSAGEANGDAVPGQSEQAEAIQALIDEVGSESVFFSYEDDLWKQAGEFDVEQHWGCFHHF